MPPATYFRQYMVAWKVRGDSEDINDEGKPINHTMPGNGQLAGLRLKKAYLPDTDSAADAARWRQLSRYLAIWVEAISSLGSIKPQARPQKAVLSD
jgi:hypothetical protein